jgi:hypothetical protein
MKIFHMISYRAGGMQLRRVLAGRENVGLHVVMHARLQKGSCKRARTRRADPVECQELRVSGCVIA